VAAFRANEIWFCEPFRPHAWPAIYTLSVEFPIVGLGVTGQTLMILTQGNPSAAVGVNPASISLSKIANVEPCLSRGSILSTAAGVFYASPNGLQVATQGNVTNVTKTLLRKSEWLELTQVLTLRAARIGDIYYGNGTVRTGVFEPTAFDLDHGFALTDFTGSFSGILFDPIHGGFSVLRQTSPVFNVWQDPWTGEIFMIHDGAIYWLDLTDASVAYEAYLWRSKIFQPTDKKNIAAVKVYFTVPGTAPTLNPTPNADLVQTFDRTQQWGLIRAYADGNLVWTRELRVSGELMRLPSGFKADFWQIEVESILDIQSIQWATSAKELAGV
jgi:hypothetical protein